MCIIRYTVEKARKGKQRPFAEKYTKALKTLVMKGSRLLGSKAKVPPSTGGCFLMK